MCIFANLLLRRFFEHLTSDFFSVGCEAQAFFSSFSELGLSLAVVCGLFIAVASLVWGARALGHAGSVAVVHRFSYSEACGMIKLYLLYRQADSLPLSHREAL